MSFNYNRSYNTDTFYDSDEKYYNPIRKPHRHDNKKLSGDMDSKTKSNFIPLQKTLINESELKTKVVEQEVECLKHDILYLAKEIKTTVKETSQELNKQGEVISRMDPKLNKISENLEKSDTLVSIIRNKFNKFAFWKGRKYSKEEDINTLPSQTEQAKKSAKYSVDELKPKEEYIVGRKTEDNEFFDILMSQLKDIQNTNKAIGNELDAQTDALCKMTKKVDTSNQYLDDLNRDINQLIR
jgi:chromosome segregation ATPase